MSVIIPFKLFCDAVTCIEKYGSQVKTKGMTQGREIKDFGITYYWIVSTPYNFRSLKGDGWTAREYYGHTIEVVGPRAHETAGELDALIMLVSLSQ